MAARNPHFRFPFTRDPVTRRVQVVEQDTQEHVVSCVGVILACPVGFRVERPEFGWPFPDFRSQPLDTGALEQAVRTFEPRAEVTARDVLDDAWQAVERLRSGEALIEVDVSVPTEGAPSG